MLAAAVQTLGLVRWPFVARYLSRAAAQIDPTGIHHEAVDLIFQALNRYLGVAVGEHLGYLLTVAWLRGRSGSSALGSPSSCSALRAGEAELRRRR